MALLKAVFYKWVAGVIKRFVEGILVVTDNVKKQHGNGSRLE